jgi:biopolymer transport protein ExbD
MRFRSRQQHSQMPEVNLVPMMDVVMTILTFFIIVSMTLTSQQSAVNIALPSANKGTSPQDTSKEPLIVGLDGQRQLIVGDKPVTEAELAQQMLSYLSKNPQGAVVLKADKNLAYEQVVQVLGKMRDVGGDRVSLAIESK